jgi:hypothetical protein
MQVFLIHSSDTKEVAFDVACALQESGYPVWIDFPSYASMSYDETIRPYMRASQLLIAIWTSTTQLSVSCLLEWKIATQLRKRIVLISVNGAKPEQIPEFCDVIEVSSSANVSTSLLQFLENHTIHTIFISYATENLGAAERLQALVGSSRHHAWIDRESLQPGDEFPQEIVRGIDQCNYVFLLWSRWAKRSRWVAREWKYARSKRREIIPILLDDSLLPWSLRSINGFRGIEDVGIKKLLGIAITNVA